MAPIALTIAGSDPSGGAGIQADLKTFHAHGVVGMAVVSLLTVQNTQGVQRVHLVAPDLVAEQLLAVLDDEAPQAVKTGALGTQHITEAVAEALASRSIPLVVDPVFASTSGSTLLDVPGLLAMQRQLLPLATLVTPNLDEAAWLVGQRVHDLASMQQAALAMHQLGARAVLIKGGHCGDDPQRSDDVLCVDGSLQVLSGPRIATRGAHGLGCALSAAITARLARGEALPEACRGAKAWLTRALQSAPAIGKGRGPINHLEPAP